MFDTERNFWPPQGRVGDDVLFRIRVFAGDDTDGVGEKGEAFFALGRKQAFLLQGFFQLSQFLQ